MTETRNRNRNEQRKARQFAAELGIKHTAALRVVRQATAERQAQAAQDARRPETPPTTESGPATGTAPRFLPPHPMSTPDGAAR